jgi:hypothetical protein
MGHAEPHTHHARCVNRREYLEGSSNRATLILVTKKPPMRRNHYPGLQTLLLTLWASMAICTPSLAGDMALLSIVPRFGFSGKTPILSWGKSKNTIFR